MLVDVANHCLIEASAGTGKTYAIEEIIVHLIMVQRVKLEDILVVTFTEKATGELKKRLRQRLEAECGDDAHALASLEAFDQAPIHTLHAFCHGLLREFPLEQGQEFVLEVVDRGALVRTALRDVQRVSWPEWYGPDLARVLREVEYRDRASAWDQALSEAGKRYRAECGHLLLPRADDDGASIAGRLWTRTCDALVQRVDRVMERRGLFTFDDMIVRVAAALDPQQNAAADVLLSRLRQRFRYAIVDEFQDTDPLQWTILRRIFAEGGAGRLFLVGDPKQAIYGFRGADLPTYVRARVELLEDHGGRLATLDTNWRSTPQLIEALNRLFENAGWFASSGVSYRTVKASGTPRIEIAEDRTGTAAFNLIDLHDRQPLGGNARHANARFVAAEIGRLLARPSPLLIREKGSTRPLSPRDIAILIGTRREADPIVRALRERRVPYSFYKQLGLWGSNEALQLGYLLEALAEPDSMRLFRRLLVTRLFRIAPEDLVRREDLADHHPARTLFARWRELADDRAWSRLFASVLEDSALLRAEASEDIGRPYANLLYLTAALEQAAYRDSLDIHGLLTFLEQERDEPAALETGLQPIETDADKVQILTIHASKGLEYPIVFLAGGFSIRGDRPSVAEYRLEGRKVLHYAERAQEPLHRHQAERAEEDERLLYVALTRAMLKLYVPYVISPEELKRPQYAGRLSTRLRPALDASGLGEAGMPTAKLIEPTPPPASPGAGASAKGAARAIEGDLFPVVDPDLRRRRIVLASFSSLRRVERAHEVSFGDLAHRNDDDAAGALDEPDPLRGAEFGDLVHRVLEKIDWAEAGSAASSDQLWREGSAARRLLDAEVARTLPALVSRLPQANLEAACRLQVARLVWFGLRTPMVRLGGPLSALPARDVLREAEFLFPGGRYRVEEGFLTGFIDLIARKDGRYFLVDWKTNLLDSYDAHSLAAAMQAADYTRQYRLYALALSRWLGWDASAFARHFGGVFYIFLRGLGGAASSGTAEQDGVFFTQPGPAELDIEAILERRE